LKSKVIHQQEVTDDRQEQGEAGQSDDGYSQCLPNRQNQKNGDKKKTSLEKHEAPSRAHVAQLVTNCLLKIKKGIACHPQKGRNEDPIGSR
jgi:non-homologous end joining protein Ku